jgi:hypothetical protein
MQTGKKNVIWRMIMKKLMFFMQILLLSIVFSSTALAANEDHNPIEGYEEEISEYATSYRYEDTDGTKDIIYVPNNDMTSQKEFYELLMDKVIERENLTTTRSAGTYSISDKDSLTHNGEELYSKFSSTIEWDYIQSSKVSGSSRAAWLGGNPLLADSIKLTDKITFTGLVVSVSASGSNWSTSIQTATWSATENSAWEIDHVYSNITCVGDDLYIKQITTGDFEFGTTHYTTTAIASKLL